jgi:flagellar hook-associated protein 2
MGRISSSVGLVTGFPIQDTVNQLIAIEAAPRDALTARQKDLQSQQAAVTQLTALTLGVQIAAKRLEKSDLFAGRQTTSSNQDLLTATASSSAAPGQYQFVPARLAQSNQVLSSGVASSGQALGGGTFSFRFGGDIDTSLQLGDLNGGSGVARGQIRITDRSGASAVVDLRYVQTIDDVVNAINGTDGIEIKAQAVGDHLVLHDSSGGGGNLRVQEVGGGTTAAGLGLSGINAQADDAAGQDLVKLFSGLQLNQLRDGNGLSVRPSIPDLQVTFKDGSNPLSITLDPIGQPAPQTVGDVIDRINTADPTRLKAQISADGKSIQLTDLTTGGGTFAVSSALGGSLAEELGLTGAAVGNTITGQRLISGLKTTLLSSLNGGQGLGTLGQITLTDRLGNNNTINLGTAQTLDDVISRINGAGLGITASYNSTKNGIVLTDTTGATTSNFIVADADATNSATKLGLASSVAGTSINSGDLHRQVVSRNTTLASYNGGQGVSLGSIVITNAAGQKTTLNLSTLQPKTIGDVIDQINAHNAGVTARINDAGDGIALVDTSAGSGTLNVADAGGTSAADLHLAGSGVATTVNNQPAQIIDGSTTYEVQLAATDTLNDLVTKINDLGAGATASVLSEGSGSLPAHLTLLSSVSGQAGELHIDASGLGLSFNDLTTGQDALLQIGGSASTGVLVSSTSNTFKTVVPGIDVSLTGTSANPVTVTVSQTSDTAAATLQSFVDQYNKLRNQLDTYTSFNSSDFTTGTLFGSTEALHLDSDLSHAIFDSYFTGSSVTSLAQLGITADDQGHLSFDKTQFQSQYNADSDGITKFFTDTSNGAAVKIDKLLESLVGEDNSLLVGKAASLQTQIDDIGQQITSWNTRLSNAQDLLLTQFNNMETAVSSIKNNLNFLNQIQFISMNGSSSSSSNSTASATTSAPTSTTTTK